MKRNFKIRVTNDQGKVGFYDIDQHSGGYPFISLYGTGKSYTYDEAKNIVDTEFVYQGSEQYPTRIVHLSAHVDNNHPDGWVDVEIVEVSYTPVENKRINAHIRSEQHIEDLLVGRLLLGETLTANEVFKMVEVSRNDPNHYPTEVKKALSALVGKLILK